MKMITCVKAVNNIMKLLDCSFTSSQTALRSRCKGEKWWIEGDIPDLEWEDKQISFQYNLF